MTTATPYAVTRQQLETYKVGPCMISLDAEQGFVSVTCSEYDELNGNHYWRARGSDSLKQFLIVLNCDYAMGKLFNRRSLEEFDRDASVVSIKREIIERRRHKQITSNEARDLWDQADGCETPDDIARIHDEYGNTYYEHITNRPKRCVEWFWTRVWAPFIQALQREVATCPTSVQSAP